MSKAAIDRDTCAVGLWSISSIDRHLRDVHGAGDEVLEARDRAWREYAKEPPCSR